MDALGAMAHDLCHRTTAGSNSRHVDRKVYKMRELQHGGVVKTVLVPTKDMRETNRSMMSIRASSRHDQTVEELAGLESMKDLWIIQHTRPLH